MEILYVLSIVACAIFSFIAGKKSNDYEIREVIQETIAWLIDEGFLRYDEKTDTLISYDE
jgi:hypothetical protein